MPKLEIDTYDPESLRSGLAYLSMLVAEMQGDLSESQCAEMLGTDVLEWRRSKNENLTFIRQGALEGWKAWREAHPLVWRHTSSHEPA